MGSVSPVVTAASGCGRANGIPERSREYLTLVLEATDDSCYSACQPGRVSGDPSIQRAVQMITSAYRVATLERFQRQRETWAGNQALRTLYAYWYGEIRAALGERLAGSVVELGSGAGFAKRFLPTLRTSDTVKAD